MNGKWGLDANCFLGILLIFGVGSVLCVWRLEEFICSYKGNQTICSSLLKCVPYTVLNVYCIENLGRSVTIILVTLNCLVYLYLSSLWTFLTDFIPRRIDAEVLGGNKITISIKSQNFQFSPVLSVYIFIFIFRVIIFDFSEKILVCLFF